MTPILRFTIAFLLLVLLISVGTIGYAWVEGWSILDSLYMTLITITTVGYALGDEAQLDRLKVMASATT